MPLDPQKVADTQEWLRKALEDRRSADVLAAPSVGLVGPAVFHCQQTVEKAFKGFLFWHDVPFRKTHELEELGDACSALDSSLVDIVNRVIILTPYAWRFRYPGNVLAPAPADVASALALAHEVYQAVLARLPAEVRP
jgi:HEPN domain-containing protein